MKKKIYLLLFLSSFLLLNSCKKNSTSPTESNINIQWENINNGLSNTQILAAASIGSNLFIISSYTGVFLSTNTGNSWSKSLDYNNYPTKLRTVGSYLFCGGGGYGSQGPLYFTRDNGTTWTQTKLSITVSDIVVTDNILYLVIEYGVLYTTDFGVGWSNINVSGVQDLRLHGFFADGNNYFLGSESGIYRSTDKGNTWNLSYQGMGNKTVYQFQKIGNNLLAGTYGSGIYYSSDDGNNWNASGGIPQNLSSSPFFVNGNKVYVGSNSGAVYVSSNNGQSWSQLGPTLPDNPAIQDLLIIDKYIIVATNNGIFRAVIN